MSLRCTALALFLLVAATHPSAAGEVWVNMDQVRPVQLDRPAGKIVIGNPGIADVGVEDADQIMLYGRSPGATNMYIFDENGEKIDNLIVQVTAAGDSMVMLQRGRERTTLSCTTNCEATVTVGDGASFGEVAGQLIQKNQQATNAPQ